jgi:cold-inducible RNA-binding protein
MFVGNLSFKTTREDLTELLAEVGEPLDVFLPLDRASGKPRGFAFVEFGSRDELEKAIALLNGREVGGRTLRANQAEDRPRRGNDRRSIGAFAGPAMFDPDDGRISRPKGSRRNVRARKRSL